MGTSKDETEQTQDQAPAPFRVGQQVRCVSTARPLKQNAVYTVTHVQGDRAWFDGLESWWYSDRFVPAVPFVDRDGKKWLVVDERQVLLGDLFVSYDAREVTKCIAECNDHVRRIVVPWQEYPAPDLDRITDAIANCAEVNAVCSALSDWPAYMDFYSSIPPHEAVGNLVRAWRSSNERCESMAGRMRELSKPLTLDKVARHIAAHYPDAEVVMVKVRGDGSIAFVPTTQGRWMKRRTHSRRRWPGSGRGTMPDTNYTALAAECEKKAEQGEKPEYQWDDSHSWSHLQSNLIHACVSEEDEFGTHVVREWSVVGSRFPRIDNTPYIKGKVAAQLFAEALLRDATKPLHREAYEAESAIISDLCTALCHATDQRMSKPGYTVDAMMSEIDEVRQRAIDKAKDELEDDLETATRIAHLVLIRSAADDSDGDELLDSYRKQIRAIVKSRGYVV